jgi:hypothetical protein
VQRQFETAMNWGRYAEIFDYDRESGRLVQTEVAQNEPAAEAAPVAAVPRPDEKQESTPAPKI